MVTIITSVLNHCWLIFLAFMIRFYPICRGAEVQGEDLLLQIFTSSILQRQAGEEAPFLEFIQHLGALRKGWFFQRFLGRGKLGLVDDWGLHYPIYGYGSIPINTIFRGMNIHKSQLFWCEQLGTRLTGGREEFSTPAMLSICFSADLQWSEHSSPFWIFHAAVPLVKAASSRN